MEKTLTVKDSKRKNESIFKVGLFLLKSLRQYRKNALWAAGLAFFQAIFDTALPFVASMMMNSFVQLIQDGASQNELWTNLGMYGGILIALAIGYLIAAIFSARESAKAAVGFAANLRADLFHKIQSFSFENIDRFSLSSLVTRQTTDISNMQMSFLVIIRIAIASPLTLIFSVVMSITVGAMLSWIYAITIPFVVIGVGTIFYFAVKIYAIAIPKYDDLNKSIGENVHGIRTVKTYAREEFEKKKFAESSGNIRKMMTKGEVAVSLSYPLMSCAFSISFILFAYLGALTVVDKTPGFGIGNWTALISYGNYILVALIMISMVLVIVSISTASARRVKEVLVEESTIVDPPKARQEVADGSIEFQNVSFKYSDSSEKYALNNLNVKISAGSTIGIIGGTGSAKSTFVNMIPRFYDVQKGSVKVGGHDVREYGVSALRDSIGMVLQKNVLFSGTVRDNMRWGDNKASDNEIAQALKTAQAYDFIKALPDYLNSHVEQGGTNFSGGQKQRLCIARALLKNPAIIIFDDSTSAVDTKTDSLIRAGLRKSLPGTTKLIVAQRILSVLDADQIFVMDGGKIVGIGTAKQLYKTNKIFQEVCNLQGVTEGQL